MRFALVAAFVSALVPIASAQRNLNPVVSNANILHPGVPAGGSSGAAPRVGLRGGRRSYGGGALLIPYPAYMDPFYSGYGGVYGLAPGGYNPAYSGYPQPYGSGYDQPPPTVIINQNFQSDTIRPQIRDYTNVPLPEPGVTIAAPGGPAPAGDAANGSRTAGDEQPNIFLIALKDQSVLAAVAYWVQDDTLNYITLKGSQNFVSLSLVDRDLSIRLNNERQIQFRLPAPR
jgi:hypothetical protein